MTLPQMEPKNATRGEAVILFMVAATTFAISANAVEEIRSVDSLRPLAQSGTTQRAKANFVLERAGKTYSVVDAGLYFGGSPALLPRLLVLRGCTVALLVEQIGLMTRIFALYALPRAFVGKERQWYRGLALLPGPGGNGDCQVVPVVNPDVFLGQAEIATLRGRSRAKEAGV
jgi:hypothetical protein